MFYFFCFLAIHRNRETLEKAFGAKVKKKGGVGSESKTGGGKTSGASKKKEKVSLVDGKRQQNCGISLKRLRMPYSKLKQIVVECDSNQLTAEMCTSLIGMAPTADEVALVKDYDGDVSGIVFISIYIYSLSLS